MSLMKTSRVVSLALALALCTALPAVADPAPPAPATAAKPEELARKLIELTGGGSLGKQVMGQMMEMFRSSNPSLPDEFWTEVMASVDEEELVSLAVPIYVKNLTVDEMQAAIDFYSSPHGRSLVTKLPVIVQESMTAGQKWGEQLGRQIYEKITKYKKAHPEA